ncbi:hypothetical protein [Streptosporangium sp. OZ121]|uniref:hypothetical protein n=1 Tax=Streptosporangium sp. OZ121 TaxID=3444183 RepID=UPI003F79886F
MKERESPDLSELSVVVDWSTADGVPIEHVNQFIGQPGPPTLSRMPDGVFLLLGSIPPPVIPNDPEGQRRAIEGLKNGLKVTVHGRFHLSRERLEELIDVLQQTAANYDTLVEQGRAISGQDEKE